MIDRKYMAIHLARLRSGLRRGESPQDALLVLKTMRQRQSEANLKERAQPGDGNEQERKNLSS